VYFIAHRNVPTLCTQIAKATDSDSVRLVDKLAAPTATPSAAEKHTAHAMMDVRPKGFTEYVNTYYEKSFCAKKISLLARFTKCAVAMPNAIVRVGITLPERFAIRYCLPSVHHAFA
jgi:hypothetical protein